MVVIEQEESEHRNASRSNAAGAANDASDGFETASEADLASDDDGGDGGADRQQEQNHPEEHHRQQQTEQQPERDMGTKLKDMGNSVLGRFGMSVDNFKAVKDPNTGSYSISFQR
ncbi:hypothetical protein V8G54_021645 [Vigna mungo]|uniref:Uncharacterized protein n=1 Tax=Vigna mungo TaxID=3915 RepID=A0AAQ3RXJ3_VIGMU